MYSTRGVTLAMGKKKDGGMVCVGLEMGLT
jgi:hypothetical protein